jgi:hypothetical protein
LKFSNKLRPPVRLPLTDAEALAVATAISQITVSALQQRVILGESAPIGVALSDEALIGVIVAAASARWRSSGR